MYGFTRATATLIGAAAAGVLMWLATQLRPIDDLGEYWGVIGLLAAAGLVVALSQLVGGWTKWGRPWLSLPVLVLAFVPALIAVAWVILAQQPDDGWLQDETRDWSEEIGIDGLVRDLGLVVPVLAFGLGLLAGLTFDTTGRVREVVEGPAETAVIERESTRDRVDTERVDPETERADALRRREDEAREP